MNFKLIGNKIIDVNSIKIIVVVPEVELPTFMIEFHDTNITYVEYKDINTTLLTVLDDLNGNKKEEFKPLYNNLNPEYKESLGKLGDSIIKKENGKK